MYRSPFQAKARQTCAFQVKGSWSAGYHTGEDWVCDTDRTLVAPASGRIQRNRVDGSYGNYIVIQTGDGNVILMAHMASRSPAIEGTSVAAGQCVGIMGSTGNSTGAHLHIEVQKGSTWAYNKNLLKPSDYVDFTRLTNPAPANPYQTGKVYTAAVDLKVRAGAGTAFRQKKTSELTADGRKHAYERADAVLKSGTRITVQEVKTVNGDIWLKIPSGWIAGCYQGKTYVK